jgi:hypothetical protein
MSAQILSIAPILPPGMERWLSRSEVLEVTGWSSRWLEIKTGSNEIVSRETREVLGNGRFVREYLCSSLPQWAQEKLQPITATLHSSTATSPDQTMLPIFPGPTDSLSPRVALPNPAQQAQAEQRWQILRPVVEFKCDPHRFSRVVLNDGARSHPNPG